MDKFLEPSSLRQYAFALVDPMVTESLPNGVESYILVPKRLLASKHLMPILLNLRQLSSEGWRNFCLWLDDSAKHSPRAPISFFVTADISTDEFLRHWNAMQLAPTSTRKFWLRLHDPRVMHQLLRILSPVQRRRLFGRAQIFHYQLGENWISAKRDHQGVRADERDSKGGSLRWDWHRVERIGIVNRALQGAGIDSAPELTRLAIFAEQLIERAMKRHGIEEDADLVEFAIRGLRINPTFDEHPTVALAILASGDSAERTSLSDRFALIEGHIWEALSSSANPSMRYQT